MPPLAAWQWAYFVRPPFDPEKDCYAGPRDPINQKFRTACIRCLEAFVKVQQAEQQRAVNSGLQQFIRSEDDLKLDCKSLFLDVGHSKTSGSLYFLRSSLST